jgi:hypothetical protein
VVAIGVHRFVPAVREGGTWSLITVAAGVYALGNATIALVMQRKAPQSLWPAWPAALMAVATLAAGAAGTSALRRDTDEFVRFVDTAFGGQERDTEHSNIQAAHYRFLGYSAARTCATTGLRLGVVSLALAMTALGRALRARRAAAAKGLETGAAPTRSASSWLAACGVMGAAALAANVWAAGRPVAVAEDPNDAEAALIARRFVAGDVSGACRVLEPATEASAEAARALGQRLPDLADKANRCVEHEIRKARALGAQGCSTLVETLAPMRFVQLAGKAETIADACEGLAEPPP